MILLPKREASLETLTRLHGTKGRRILKSYNWLGGMQVVQLAPGEDMDEAIVRYRASGSVEFAEPDFKLYASASPNDPEFRRGSQWSFYNSGQFGGKIGSDIGAVAGWDTITSASNIVVAVIDSGIRYTHEDLAANIWTNPNEIAGNGIDDDRNGIIDDVHGLDSINNSGDPMDDAGHGTHVAGIIGGVGNNGIGVAGVAWNVKLMGCRFLSKVGDGDTSDAIQCIDYARRMGANVINASWGGPDYSAALLSAINNARSAGIIFVTAAGNDSEDLEQSPLYPASYNLDNIVVVGGSTRTDTMDTGYSNYGATTVDLFAPGTSIYSTWHTWDGSYTSNTGTSMAAPHVSGIVALMKARFPTYSTAQIVERLLATVDVIPALNGKCKTGGRVNMARALGPNPAAGFSASKLSGEPPLTVAFTNLSYGEIARYRWNFGDASPTETNASPSHVFEYAGTFRVELQIEGTNGQTNSYEQVIKVASNYQTESETYAWIEPADMPSFSLSDNGVSSEQLLPFPFRFYGETYRSIYIGANGVLSFSSTDLDTSDNTVLPTASAPNALICPYWDNLNPAAGGSIHAGIIGEAPNRKYVVSWVNIRRNSSAVSLTFQAILEEATQNVIFQYAEVHPEAQRGGAKRATVGLENGAGSVGALFAYNGSPVVLQNNSAIRFGEKPFRYLSANLLNGLRFTGVKDHGFADTNALLRLHNAGNQEIEWKASSDATWLVLSSLVGSLAPDETVEIDVSLTSAAYDLSVGKFEDVINVVNHNDGRGDRAIPVTLEVEAPQAAFHAELLATNLFSGGYSGPFSPENLAAVIRNTGNIPVHWTVSSPGSWLDLNATEGELLPGETTMVEIQLNSAAEQFESGRQSTELLFNVLDLPQVQLPVYLQVNSRIEPHSASITNGKFGGVLAIPATGSYFIEASEDFINWWPLDLTPKVVGQNVHFEDPDGISERRFYRLVVME